jgi:hypothetical protein
MATDYQGLNEPRNSRLTSTWGLLGSVIFHALIVAAVVLVFHERPSRPRVVVPLEAVTLIPFRTGPKGGGGGRHAPVCKPGPVAGKVAMSPKVKHQRHPKAKLAPPPEPTPAPGRGAREEDGGPGPVAGWVQVKVGAPGPGRRSRVIFGKSVDSWKSIRIIPGWPDAAISREWWRWCLPSAPGARSKLTGLAAPQGMISWMRRLETLSAGWEDSPPLSTPT